MIRQEFLQMFSLCLLNFLIILLLKKKDKFFFSQQSFIMEQYFLFFISILVFLGALLRFIISKFFAFSLYSWGTLLVNVLACIIMGICLALS